jgi:hypothetical protein
MIELRWRSKENDEEEEQNRSIDEIAVKLVEPRYPAVLNRCLPGKGGTI